MGYKATKKFLLKFPEGQYEGLEVHVRSVPFGQFFELDRLSKAAGQARDLDSVNQLLGKLAEHITGWNLEDEDDQPIPVSVDALKDLDVDLVLAIIAAWLEGMVGVSAPLDKKSPAGSAPGDLESLPRESL